MLTSIPSLPRVIFFRIHHFFKPRSCLLGAQRCTKYRLVGLKRIERARGQDPISEPVLVQPAGLPVALVYGLWWWARLEAGSPSAGRGVCAARGPDRRADRGMGGFCPAPAGHLTGLELLSRRSETGEPIVMRAGL